ncbi:hypothetical protein [Hymenobacter sp.]|uniref:hypothetical protein n=1 Tax=Hymenobacter sp. TaxID=1898978 RepID=UPI00286AFA2A|nr:hypothetical protein [Hymenobacter sp.]
MKTFVFPAAVVFAFLSTGALRAQTAAGPPAEPTLPPWARTQVHVGLGVAAPQLRAGQALLANKNRRAAEGSYGRQLGQTVEIGFYKPLRAVPGLLLGANFKLSLTGSEPDAGYPEGYYFNPGLLGAAAKYYPLRNGAARNLFVRAEGGVSFVLEKTRFVNDQGAQNFFHQFGVGAGALGGLGYSLPVGKRRGLLLEPALTYELHGTRVEVNGVGDDPWRFGVLSGMLTLSF